MNGYHQQRGVDLEVLLDPYWVAVRTGTTHGTPFSYDAHVPIIFFGSGIRAGRYDAPVVVNDIAPTLATLLDVETPSGSGGARAFRDLRAVGCGRLLLAQGGGGIQPRGAPGGEPAGQGDNPQEEQRRNGERGRVGSPHVHQHAGHHARGRQRRRHSQGDARQSQAEPAAYHQLRDAGGSRSQRHANADLGGALLHLGSHHAIQSDGRQQQGDGRKGPDEQRREARAGPHYRHGG